MGANIKIKGEGTAVNGKACERSKVKNDIIFIAVLLALILVFSAFYLFSREEGDTVIVTVGLELYGEYPLSEDKTVEIRNGEAVNLLIIEGGRAWIEYASCPDGVCSAHRAISHNGDSIICRPNAVVVEVRKKISDGPDIIV